jgi:membrane protease YdiL (CAAX protease family)
MHWLELPAVKWAVPLPMLALVAPVVWLAFRRTWKELDAEALVWRRELAERGEVDYRPVVALTLVAVILTWQEFYGRPDFYLVVIRPLLTNWAAAHPRSWIDPGLYDDLYGRAWWGATRIGGYLLPLAVWPLFFRRDRIADFGLHARGFRTHAWIYAACVVVMVPVLLLVSRQPDFANYYPMYKLAGRSWLDFAIWEAVYLAQFFTLELFFRGWWLRAMRGFGAGAIWAMVVPYCMVHYGKPYLEASAAIIAGVVLGSLAMRTRSIYAGFLVHATVAVLMDVLALGQRNFLPVALAPGSKRQLAFSYWTALIWIAWALALVVLALKLRRAWPELRAMAAKRRSAQTKAQAVAGPGPS